MDNPTTEDMTADNPEDESLFVQINDDVDQTARSVEATLFASEKPMTITEIKLYVGEEADVKDALAKLQKDYEDRGIVLMKTGDRWHFQTAQDLSHLLRRERAELRKLSRAGMETLAIIAYHEPVSRAEIEAIRGVQVAKGTLDVLMEAGWVRPAGRRDVPGRPLIYATTSEFLTHFGLQSRKDLPGVDDLKAAGLLDPVDMALEKMEMEAEQEEASEQELGDDEIDDNGEWDSVLLENETESA